MALSPQNTHFRLMLRSQHAAITLGSEDVAIETRNPLPPLIHPH